MALGDVRIHDRVGGLELAQDVVPEADGVRETLEPEPVLGEARDRERAGDAPRATTRFLYSSSTPPASVSTVTCLEPSSTCVISPSTRSACGHIIRSGTTTWRGSRVPDAASGSVGV